MIPVKTKIKELFGIIVIISIASFVLILLITGEDAIYAFLRVGAITSIVIYPFWLFFEKFGWRTKLLRLGGFLCVTPDLNGRWEGIIDRGDEVGPHSFVIEINQTLTSIQINTFSSRGSSFSFIAEIASDPQQKQFKLIYTWLAKTGILVGRDQYEPGLFYGTSILDFINGSGPNKVLDGIYYTNRSPVQTKGIIHVTWTGSKLCSCFDPTKRGS